jgi:hypothetical protein
MLQPGQLGAAGGGQVEQLAELVAAERLLLGGALDLHEVAGGGADHVHVGLRGHVFLVAQVEPGLAVHDADADRGDRGDQRVALGPFAVAQPGHGVGQRDVAAGDRRGASAAVGLEHVAVDHDGVLAQRLVVQAGPQRAPDQPGYLLGAAAQAALDRLAVAARVGRPGQHGVLGGHPAEPAAAPPPRHVLGDAGSAQHAGPAELDQHRALGVFEPAPGQLHRPQVGDGSSVGS